MSKKEKPRNSTSTKFIQSGTTTTTANCLILSSKSWSLYLQQDQADRQDPLVRVDQEDPTNTQKTSTQTMSKTTNQQWYDKQQRWDSFNSHKLTQVSITHMLSFTSLGALLTMLSNLTLHWQTSNKQTSRYSKDKFETNPWNEWSSPLIWTGWRHNSITTVHHTRLHRTLFWTINKVTKVVFKRMC